MRGNDAQFLSTCAVGEVTREEIEERLHLGVESLALGGNSMMGNEREGMRVKRTFLVSESLTVLTRALSSLRMALAATPVVEVLKSM